MATPNQKRFSVRNITLTALMAALCFVGATLRIQIPLAAGEAMIHFGNIFMLLGGLLLGGLPGGLAAGMGMSMSDLFSGTFALYAPGTFIGKFLAGFICGKLAHRNGARTSQFRQSLMAAIAGILTNIVCSSLNTLFVKGILYKVEFRPLLLTVAGNFGLSIVNGIIAVAVSLALYFPLHAALSATERS